MTFTGSQVISRHCMVAPVFSGGCSPRTIANYKGELKALSLRKNQESLFSLPDGNSLLQSPSCLVFIVPIIKLRIYFARKCFHG